IIPRATESAGSIFAVEPGGRRSLRNFPSASDRQTAKAIPAVGIGGGCAVVGLAIASNVGARELQRDAWDWLLACVHRSVVVIVHIDISGQPGGTTCLDRVHLVEQSQQLVGQIDNRRLSL